MMNVVNLKGAIIGESVPRVEFSFKKGDTVKTIDRSKLEKLDTLSQGEKRALYLLNIIFDIEQIKNTGEEKNAGKCQVWKRFCKVLQNKRYI